MLPGNMIIVIICTLLRSYPPDSSPLRNSPVILPAWLPPFSLFLSSFLFLSRSIPAVVPSCVMLRGSLLHSPSRHADLFPSPIVDSILPHPRSPCVDLSPLPLADELRGNEREQGRSNRPSTETVFLSRPFRLSSCILSSSPFPAVARKTLQCEMLSLRRTFRLALSLSVFLSPFVSLFIFPVVARGPTFFRGSRFLFRSLLLPRNSFPRAVHSDSSLRKRFIDRHSRLFFLRAFSRLLELFSRV